MRAAARIALLATGALGIAVVLLGARAVLGDEGRVVGTKHDVATPGTAVCSVCHIPRDPKGLALWADPPNKAGKFSGIKPLCFSCHDGTVAAADYNYVFDPARPEHPLTPGLRGQDCDRCHDAHREEYGKFIKLPGGANFCQSCHPRAGPADHPVDVNARDAGVDPLDSDWSPYGRDFSGTRLWDSNGAAPGGLVKCLTCHSPHGGQPSTQMNTLPFLPTHNSSLSLCQSCHPRGGGE